VESEVSLLCSKEHATCHSPETFESRSGVRVPVRARNSLLIIASRPALGSAQPPVQWVPGALSLWVKRPEREADHSPPSSAEAMDAWRYTFTPPVRLLGVVLN
jgi:hypothetical protein